ncbi:transposase [uncultured Deinococcus sp.]|uniref:IS701 family transposase n=1 Tax=uncultured Deinococcus sp. TaxID=158789 RepID=UPI0025D168F6|nr:transposase [uncultured Deinococcus sp.]
MTEPDDLHQVRLNLMRTVARTAPTVDAVLVIDETGDRKYGTHSAHVGRQYLGSLGKVDSGIVTVHVLYDTPEGYFPLRLVPYTPAHHFPRKQADPGFHTKPQLAVELIDAVRHDWPFRAVVADCLYGRNEVFQTHLLRQHIPFVMTLPATHTWWHFEDEPGGVEDLALRAAPAAWHPFTRTYADGHTEVKWLAELSGGPFGTAQSFRLVVVTPDPVALPRETTEYLISNLRVAEEDTSPGRAPGPAATPVEIALLYARRPRIEQAYREVKQHLGWAQCQARSDLALRRHWSLVCAAFCFLYWWGSQSQGEETDQREGAAGAAHPPSWSALLRHVRLWLEPFIWVWRAWRAFSSDRPPQRLRCLLARVARGQGLPLYTS